MPDWMVICHTCKKEFDLEFSWSLAYPNKAMFHPQKNKANFCSKKCLLEYLNTIEDVSIEEKPVGILTNIRRKIEDIV